MPEPLAIYGATNTTYGLAKELYGYIQKWATAKDKAKKIQTRFAWTSAQAEVYVKFFKDHESKLGTDLAKSIMLATRDLETSLIKVKAKVDKYDPETWYRHLQWPWVVDSLDDAEKALLDWVSRLSNTFKALPSDVQDTLRKYILNSTAWEKIYPAAALLEHIEMVKTRDDVGKKDAAMLLSTIRGEPFDKPEKDIHYWKDIIVVPEDILQNDKRFRDFKVEIAKLVEVLKSARSDFTHVPQASCWFQKEANKFGIAYRIPSTIEIIPKDEKGVKLRNSTYTLKDLVQRKAEHTLDERLSLATQIASAVSSVHGLGWVHKSLRSDNIVLGYHRHEPQPFVGLGRVYLKGFNVARRSIGRSTGAARLDAINWESQVYVHPQRQLINVEGKEDDFYDALKSIDEEQHNGASTAGPGLLPVATPNALGDLRASPRQEFFKYKHDIYSLGVILLELGLWQDIKVACPALEQSIPEQRMDLLRKLAKEHLGLVVGQKYLQIVTSCLNIDEMIVDLDFDESEWCHRRVLEELYEIRL